MGSDVYTPYEGILMNFEKRAQEILSIQKKAVQNLELTPAMLQAISKLIEMGTKGNRIITLGMGKAGFIAKKMSATLASIGLPSFFIHPAEGLHGDVGRVQDSDLLIIFSHSGKTSEVSQFITTLDQLNQKKNAIIVISNNPNPQFRSTITVKYEMEMESCVVSKVPSTSTTLMLLISDIIAITAAESLGFSDSMFQLRHPGGSIGLSYKMDDKH
ncbi:MAG: SIS domain-containing protein [Promethearchaeota archaeon]